MKVIIHSAADGSKLGHIYCSAMEEADDMANEYVAEEGLDREVGYTGYYLSVDGVVEE